MTLKCLIHSSPVVAGRPGMALSVWRARLDAAHAIAAN
jgi:hypothetical protein